MRVPFVKMQGLGNDFIVLDEREGGFGLAPSQLATMADRRFGIGCDQILSIEVATDERAAARYRVFNADGSPAEHCGNGVRCIARYFERRGELRGDTVGIEIGTQVFHLAIEDDGMVRADMGRPRFAPADVPITDAEELERYAIAIEGRDYVFGAVSVGNPHAVFPVDDVATAPVASLGAALQVSARFPERVNVGFMEVVSPLEIRLRVYERGAGETLACGTGACAAVAIGRRWGLLEEDVTVSVTGGQLRIHWSGDPDRSIWMTGPATFVFEGTIEV